MRLIPSLNGDILLPVRTFAVLKFIAMHRPFSVIIPVYNAAYELRGALASIALQTLGLGNIEIVVVDDGSIDNVEQVVTQFKERHQEADVRLVSKKNGGWGSVFNFVKNHRLVNGDYVCILDADDRLHPKICERVKQIFGCDLIICDFVKRGRRCAFPVHTYAAYVKRPSKPRQAQTPYCIPLGKFFKREMFYSLPDLKENRH